MGIYYYYTVIRTTKANKYEECGKSFSSEEEFSQHMNQEHVGNT